MIELRAVNLWYRSQHEEIELISEEDFYLTAPETISRPVSAVVHVYMHACILILWRVFQCVKPGSQYMMLVPQAL